MQTKCVFIIGAASELRVRFCAFLCPATKSGEGIMLYPPKF